MTSRAARTLRDDPRRRGRHLHPGLQGRRPRRRHRRSSSAPAGRRTRTAPRSPPRAWERRASPRPPPRPAASTTSRRWPSAASSTAWSASTRTAPSSGTRCSGTTSAPPARRPTSSASSATATRRPAGRPGPTRSASSRSPPSPRPSCAGSPTPSPANADRTAAVCLPHDWLTWQLSADRRPGRAGHRPRRRERHRLLVGPHRRVPPRPARAARCAAAGRPCPAWPGRPRPSGTLRGGSAVARARAPATTPRPPSASPPGPATSSSRSAPPAWSPPSPTTAVADATGTVAGFADATGHHLPLVATLNAARVLDAAAPLLGVDHAGSPTSRCRRRPGAGGLVLVPYLEGERTPNLPRATGSVHGLTLRTSTPAPLGARRGRGPAVRAGRRHRGGRRAGRGRRAGAADRRRRAVTGGAAARAGDLRPAGARCRRPASTSPTAPPGRPPGCCPAPTRRRTGTSPGLQPFESAPAPGVRERYAEVRGRTDGQ